MASTAVSSSGLRTRGKKRRRRGTTPVPKRSKLDNIDSEGDEDDEHSILDESSVNNVDLDLDLDLAAESSLSDRNHEQQHDYDPQHLGHGVFSGVKRWSPRSRPSHNNHLHMHTTFGVVDGVDGVDGVPGVDDGNPVRGVGHGAESAVAEVDYYKPERDETETAQENLHFIPPQHRETGTAQDKLHAIPHNDTHTQENTPTPAPTVKVCLHGNVFDTFSQPTSHTSGVPRTADSQYQPVSTSLAVSTSTCTALASTSPSANGLTRCPVTATIKPTDKQDNAMRERQTAVVGSTEGTPHPVVPAQTPPLPANIPPLPANTPRRPSHTPPLPSHTPSTLTPSPTLPPTHHTANLTTTTSPSSSLPSPWTSNLVATMLGRCAYSSAIILSALSADELLLQATGEDIVKQQRVSTRVASLSALINFWTGPIAGGLMDARGRKSFLIGAPALAALARLVFSKRPSVGTYVLYRVAVSAAVMPFFGAFRASIADVTDRTTDTYTSTMVTVDTVAALVRVVTLMVMGRIKDPKKCMQLSIVMAALSSLWFALATKETLAVEKQSAMKWNVLKNPFASLGFFQRSLKLKRLAVLSVLFNVPNLNSTVKMLRKHRFGWGMAENARMALVNQFILLVAPSAVFWVQRLQLTQVARSSLWLGAICNLLNVYGSERLSPASATLQAFRHESTAFDRILSKTSSADSTKIIGQGQREAAVNNLSLILQLIVPNIYSEMYTRVSPTSASLLCAVLQIANAELAIPLLWPTHQQ